MNSILFVVSVNSFWVDGQHKNLDRANIFLNSTNFFQVFFLLLLVGEMLNMLETQLISQLIRSWTQVSHVSLCDA